MMPEETVWKGNPSQITNLGLYLLCLLTCWLIVPIFIALWKWIETKCFVYELTSERLKITRGVFSKRTDVLELYRVKDLVVERPFFLRLFSRGNVVLDTSDKSSPRVVIQAVPKPQALSDTIRNQVEVQRQAKHVREVDFE
ncbi:MAG: PH domain-containing protein [Verrucomicrobia bacterium]|nr:PH domain-containing protein [Verrucomicrobiota bacterium]